MAVELVISLSLRALLSLESSALQIVALVQAVAYGLKLSLLSNPRTTVQQKKTTTSVTSSPKTSNKQHPVNDAPEPATPRGQHQSPPCRFVAPSISVADSDDDGGDAASAAMSTGSWPSPLFKRSWHHYDSLSFAQMKDAGGGGSSSNGGGVHSFPLSIVETDDLE